ncbi:nickel pincer cofactor biosynthesis protein LarC [Desulfofundulus thermobenzoicus]|uniref:Pyridinium-3,5-bisthiocarboxylic acid mononucleotide nickel insertion protein n=1 Tax=Desulfofundulus thermobenzoicus TaxID=29376 RepID=A0A6N7IRT5_9FIRM|nr:nickel pincer cofactor biosynthesis protein LarC [Desulfofundulus thermobenzoicus]
MKILYLDCFSGISGDMMLGALIDAGVPPAAVQSQLDLLGLEGYSLKIYQDKTHGFQGTRFLVEMEQYHHSHRTWEDIRRIIEGSGLHPQVKRCALDIFEKLARAEGKVHWVEPRHVHFHEVGAVDSIVDIVGTSIALREAGVEKVYCSPLPTGYGTVQTHHGVLPVPAPATAELLKGFPIRPVEVEGELVTPTGAAIVAALAGGFGPLPAMKIAQIGYGLGANDYGIPNFLRVFIGEEIERQPASEQEISILQTNIDDLNPEILAYVTEKLLASGALDVWLTPVIMKKGRPGNLLTVLCQPGKEEELMQLIFTETSTLGVRRRREKRFCLPRKHISVETEFGTVRVKVATCRDDSGWQMSPEYEDCRRLALEKNVPLKNVYMCAIKAAQLNNQLNLGNFL